MDNIVERVKKIVAEQLGVNEADIKNESSFVDDLGADSLDTVELVMAQEREKQGKKLKIKRSGRVTKSTVFEGMRSFSNGQHRRARQKDRRRTTGRERSGHQE
eukprot:TRINITY_DN365_c0_g1_i12.p1 TRINITY_DN365_c0_g1~~TRINITY_DN365_c0_g1_i12.p1  ORF type:complete len:103 (-),score=1.95 TRINITY_DN365_c0_g1_i12:61-369(-)